MYYAIVEVESKNHKLHERHTDGYIVFFINFNNADIIDALIRFYVELYEWKFVSYEEAPSTVEMKDFPGDNNVKRSAFKEAMDKGYSYVLYIREKPLSTSIKIKTVLGNWVKRILEKIHI